MDPVSNRASDLLPIQDSGFSLENLPEPHPPSSDIPLEVQPRDGVRTGVPSFRVGELYIRDGRVHGDGSYRVGHNLNVRIRDTPDGDTVRGSLSGEGRSAAVEVTPLELRVGGSLEISGIRGSIENRYRWNGGPPTTVLGVSAQVGPVTSIGVSSVDRPGNGKDQVDVNVTHNFGPDTRVSATFTRREDGSTGGGVSVQGKINDGFIRADVSAGGHNFTDPNEWRATVIVGGPLR